MARWLRQRLLHAVLLLVSVGLMAVAHGWAVGRVNILNARLSITDSAVITYQVWVPANKENRSVEFVAFEGGLDVSRSSPQDVGERGPQLLNFPKVRLDAGCYVLTAILTGEQGKVIARDERRVRVRDRSGNDCQERLDDEP